MGGRHYSVGGHCPILHPLEAVLSCWRLRLVPVEAAQAPLGLSSPAPRLGVLLCFWPLPFCHLANLSPTEAVGRCPWTPTQRRLPHCGATLSPSPACLGDTGTVPSCGHCHCLRDEGLCSRLAWTTPWAARHHLLAPAHLPA